MFHPGSLVIRQGHAEYVQEGNSGGKLSDNRPIGTYIEINMSQPLWESYH
jgi:hypothetical protein